MTTVKIDLPESLVELLSRSPLELQQQIRLAAAADWYRQGLISQGRAAEIAGVSREEFVDALAERGIAVVQLSLAELDDEMNAR